MNLFKRLQLTSLVKRKEKKAISLPKPKKAKVYRCAKCSYCVRGRHAWFCKAKTYRIKWNMLQYKSICGKERPKTSPIWCPLK